MKKEELIIILKSAFNHLIYEENVKVGNIEVLLYFPTMGLAILESSASELGMNVEDLREHIIRKELNAEIVYLDCHEDGFNVGHVINDMILTAGLVPLTEVDFEEDGGANYTGD